MKKVSTITAKRIGDFAQPQRTQPKWTIGLDLLDQFRRGLRNQPRTAAPRTGP